MFDNESDDRAYEASLRAGFDAARMHLASAELRYTTARNRLRRYLETKEGKK